MRVGDQQLGANAYDCVTLQSVAIKDSFEYEWHGPHVHTLDRHPSSERLITPGSEHIAKGTLNVTDSAHVIRDIDALDFPHVPQESQNKDDQCNQNSGGDVAWSHSRLLAQRGRDFLGHLAGADEVAGAKRDGCDAGVASTAIFFAE